MMTLRCDSIDAPGRAVAEAKEDDKHWIPAFAGMTERNEDSRLRGNDIRGA